MSNLSEAVIENAPFQHIVIDNFFDEEYYRYLVNVINNDTTKPLHLPEEHCYPDEQHIIEIKDITENSIFWEDFMQKMSSAEVLADLKELWNLKHSINSVGYTIHKDKKGFWRGEHNDLKPWARELVSLQIYCPTNDELEHNGTWLGKEGKDCKLISFVPNRAWIFKCSEDSFHHVKRIKENTIDRNSVLIKYINEGENK